MWCSNRCSLYRCVFSFLVLGTLSSIAWAPHAYADRFRPSAGASSSQYANEETLSTRLDGALNWKSDKALLEDERIPVRELHVKMFYESGPTGDKSFDLDSSAIRFNLSQDPNQNTKGHFWFGRVHPFLEGRPSETLSQTEAIGSNWVQNQSDALDPSISGWIGGGLRAKNEETGFGFTLAYSPLFLPSFGPRVTLDEIKAPQAARFG
ncbi:MAG: hypothetical protein AABZ55_03790, partial [Bdellovibrionota bacterium]